VILVDASIWIDHLRGTNPVLVDLLNTRRILGHPFVRGEISLGSVGRRTFLLEMLDALPQIMQATNAEVFAMIEARQWFARGVGYVDAHILAATIIMPGALLWTTDRRLDALAKETGCRFVR
jgi:predicted nucleic acid-binding protein